MNSSTISQAMRGVRTQPPMHMTLELLIMRLYLAVNLLSTSAPRTPLYLIDDLGDAHAGAAEQETKLVFAGRDGFGHALRALGEADPQALVVVHQIDDFVAQPLKMLLHGAFQIIRNVLRRDDKFSAH